jgi:hypothetical protein
MRLGASTRGEQVSAPLFSFIFEKLIPGTSRTGNRHRQSLTLIDEICQLTSRLVPFQSSKLRIGTVSAFDGMCYEASLPGVENFCLEANVQLDVRND